MYIQWCTCHVAVRSSWQCLPNVFHHSSCLYTSHRPSSIPLTSLQSQNLCNFSYTVTASLSMLLTSIRRLYSIPIAAVPCPCARPCRSERKNCSLLPIRLEKYVNRPCILSFHPQKPIQLLFLVIFVIMFSSTLPQLPAHVHPRSQAFCHVVSATHNFLRYSAQAIRTGANVCELCSTNTRAVTTSGANTACIACSAVVRVGAEARGRRKVETSEGCRLAKTVTR